MSYEKKNRVYLTENMNEVFALIQGLTGKVDAKEKGAFQNLFEKLPFVARTRVELVTSGL